MRVSYDGQLCCTISDDKSMKIFDVENFGKQIFIVLVLVTQFVVAFLSSTLYGIHIPVSKLLE